MKHDRQQIAALPLRMGARGTVEVLMITSRDTGRWIVPKGWTMPGRKPWDAAAIEALEEAGVEGSIGQEPFGAYKYRKRLDDGTSRKVRVSVYPLIVETLLPRWKEKDERTRKWFPTREAAKLVDEPDLAGLLTQIKRKPKKLRPQLKFLKRSAA